MKKIKYLLILCVLMLLATGCVKYNATMDIKKDKSMEFKIIYALDKSIFGEAASIKEEDLKNIKEAGFTSSKYSEGTMEGVTLVKKINNIDEYSTENEAEYDLSGMMDDANTSKYFFKVVKGEDKNTYYAKFKFNANDSGLNTTDDDMELPDESDDLTGGMDFSGMMANMDLSFTVNLPYSALSSNATTKENDNKKLVWKLGADKQEYIEFAFEIPNNAGSDSNLILYLAIGGGVLLLAIILILIFTGKNKKGEVVNNYAPKEEVNHVNENVTPVDMPTPEPEPTLNKNE